MIDEDALYKYPIHELSNVLMTPHNADYEESAMSVKYEDIFKKILEHIKIDS